MILVGGCPSGGPCEYKTYQTTARVSIATAASPEFSCTDPVEVTVAWNDHAMVLTTGDGRNLPRACLDDVGLSEGAEVNITVQEITEGSCAPFFAFLAAADMDTCENLCEEPPECPATEPTVGASCFGSLSCHYGTPVVCPPEPGTSPFYDCVEGKWTTAEKENCITCGVSCEPPCSYCAEVAAEGAVPPDQITTFCTASSKMLYDAFWNCMCVPGGACESVCGPVYCQGGALSAECQNCLATSSASGGCLDEFGACSNDI